MTLHTAHHIITEAYLELCSGALKMVKDIIYGFEYNQDIIDPSTVDSHAFLFGCAMTDRA